MRFRCWCLYIIFLEGLIIKNSFFFIICTILLAGLFSCSDKPFNSQEQRILDLQNHRNLYGHLNEFDDSSPDIQYRLTLAIANSRDSIFVPSLTIMLQRPTILVRFGAAFALGQMESKGANSALLARLLIEQNEDVKKQIYLSLGKIGDVEILKSLIYNFDIDENPKVFLRTLIYFFNRKIINEESVKYCVKYLLNEDYIIGRSAAIALNKLSEPDLLMPYLNELKFASKSFDPQIRAKIMKPLSLLEFDDKKETFQNLMNDKSASVRVEIVRALPKIPESDFSWQKAIHDNDPFVAGLALETIPADININFNSLKYIKELIKPNHSDYLRGAAIQFLTARNLMSNPRISDFEDNHLPYYIAGLISRNDKASLKILDSLSYHYSDAVATPAYLGTLKIAEYLYDNDSLKFEKLYNYIKQGLDSGKPTQIALAANTMRNTDKNYFRLIPKLYKILDEIETASCLEVVLEIFNTLKTLQPQDAAEHINPFLESDVLVARKEARNLLESLYNIKKEDFRSVKSSKTSRINLTNLKKYGLEPKVRLKTTKGTIIIKCDGFYTPYTTSTFLELINSGFYNGLTFHRVVPNFVVQGGDPRGDGWGGPDFILLNERSPKSYTLGSVGMASAGPDTEGSQFFVTISDQPHLDYNYTRFGEVVSGMETIFRITRGDRILSAKILQNQY